MHDADGVMRGRACLPYLRIMCWIAHYGLMGPIREIGFGCGNDVCSDLSQVDPEHLRSLILHMTDSVELEKLHGDLTILFRSLSCKRLLIKDMKITKEHSIIIVRNMQLMLEELTIQSCEWEHVKHLTSYDGQGACKRICLEYAHPLMIEAMERWQYEVKWISITIPNIVFYNTCQTFQSGSGIVIYQRDLIAM